MPKFKENHSALGHFWPSTKPDNKWPGRVFLDTFPSARLHCIGRAPGDGNNPDGRLTLHGLTEDNQCVTMLEAAARFGGLSVNSRSATQRIAVTANYMLVGSAHFDESASVRRVSFASSVAEHVLRLWADPWYNDIRHRKVDGNRYESPILQKQVASYVDLDRRIRVRAFRPNVPTTTIDPKSFWTIDFLQLVTPRKALGVLHEFRALLALICGDLIDLWDLRLLHKKGEEYTGSELYFADPVEHPANSDGFPTLPILDIGCDRPLFRKVIAAWLAELPARKIGRGAFAAILQDKGTLRFSHLRELVTIIEMQERKAGTAPLSKAQFRALRCALKAVVKEVAEKQTDSAEWRETIENRINYINSYDAKILLTNFISRLPPGFVSLPDSFPNDVIKLRDNLVHDISRLKSDAQNKLAFFVAKLKALYALSDAIALGARPDEVREGSRFFTRAKYTPTNLFADDTSDSSDE